MGREMERNMPEATLRNGRRQCNPITERNKQLLLHTHTRYDEYATYTHTVHAMRMPLAK